jgi:hypothetical protein
MRIGELCEVGDEDEGGCDADETKNAVVLG